MTSHLSTGFLVGSWAAGITVVILLVCTVGTLLLADEGDRPLALLPGLLLLLTVGIYVAATWPPFDMQYHRYVAVGGTISAIQSRGLADGNGGTTFNYAVQFGGDEAYRCDDTRCAVLKPGDELHLWCVRDFQWNATPGWDCNYADSRTVKR